MAEKLKTARSEKGMSIVELIVGIIILLILLAGVLFFFDFGIGNFKLTQARGMLSQEADNVMEETLRQVRVASSFMVPVGSGWVGQPIRFKGDVLGGTPSTTSDVMFYQSSASVTSGSKLMRSEDGGASAVEIADRVTDLVFTYYDKDGMPLGNSITIENMALIKKVEIRFVMERPVPGRSPIWTTRNGTVVIRSKLS